MTYVITDPCKTCLDAACLSVCPVDCIIKGSDQYHIDPDICTECAACVYVCPVNAILHEDDLDEPAHADWQEQLRAVTFS